MISTQLPACHRLVNGKQAANILYTLAKYTSPNHLTGIDAKEFHALLCSAHIITIEHPLPEKKDAITCFQVIATHHCGHLCPMCPYFTQNRNRLEIEESTLLSYALKNYDSFLFLKKSGLTAEHFQSIFLLNDTPSGRIVSTLPLFRLAYSYVCHTCHTEGSSHSFQHFPIMITNALDQNNRGKLLPQNIQQIQKYLEQLQTLSNSMTNKNIKDSLSLVLLSAKAERNTEKNYTLDTAKAALTKQKDYINDLFDFAPVKSPLIPNLPEDSLFYPTTFSMREIDNIGYPFHTILENTADLRQLEAFLQFNPLVGIELVADAETGREMMLLCASNQFYYVSTDNKQLFSLLHLYFSKSSVRKQICMDPYKIYYFLQHNNTYYQNVFSLRAAYRVLSEAKGKIGLKRPSEIIKELVSKTNTYNYSTYIFSMLHYVKMYEVLSKHPVLSQEEHAHKFRVLSSVETLLGISYELKEIADTQNPLFNLNEKLECQFHYTNDLKLREGIYSVTFTFSHDKPIGSLVTNILYRISQKNLAQIYGYRLLRFSQNSFTIATTAEYYGQLCEIVANLSSYLATKQNLISLIIKEDIIK